MTRQFRCIAVTKSDSLGLRELIRPFDSTLPDFAKPVLTKLATKIYAALIELERVEEVNIPMSEDECLIVNQRIGNEEWDGSLALLRQTWAVVYEWANDMPPSTAFLLEEILNTETTEDAEDADRETASAK